MIKIGEQIAVLRKENSMTQEDLAVRLGVTNQAVSKWESDKCCPDIELLPKIADIFGCSIDKLFGRQAGFSEGGNTYELCTEFPWLDDDVFRGVVCLGRKILDVSDGLADLFTFEYKGEAKSVKTECNLNVIGNVSGGCSAGDSATVTGNVSGGCNAGDGVNVGCNLAGGCHAGDSINVRGNIAGGVNCGDNVTVGGGITGSVSCGSNVSAQYIKGDVRCEVVKCPEIDGDIKIM